MFFGGLTAIHFTSHDIGYVVNVSGLIGKTTDGGNTWTQQHYLKADNVGAGDKFGISVAISGDTAVIGASNYSSNKGKIYIYKRSGTAWNSEQTIEGEATDDYFGHSVSIDSDTIAVSANEKGMDSMEVHYRII